MSQISSKGLVQANLQLVKKISGRNIEEYLFGVAGLDITL